MIAYEHKTHMLLTLSTKGKIMDNVIKGLTFNSKRGAMFTILFIGLIVLVSWIELIDKSSSEYIDSALVQATTTFAVARGFNAIVSVLQEFSITVFGLEFAIGQMLDPINDLVEQFSSMMKIALGSLIIQKILLEIVSQTFFKTVVTISGVVLAAAVYFDYRKAINPAFKLFIFMCFLRFSVVMVVILYSALDTALINDKVEKDKAMLEAYPMDPQSFLANEAADQELRLALIEDRDSLLEASIENKEMLEKYKQELAELEDEKTVIEADLDKIKSEMTASERWSFRSNNEDYNKLSEELKTLETKIKEKQNEIRVITTDISKAESDIARIENTLAGKSNSIFESVGQSLSNVTGGLANLREKMGDFVDRISDAIPNMVNLMALFFLKTLILPLGFLLVFLKAYKMIWGVNLRAAIEKSYTNLKEEIKGN